MGSHIRNFDILQCLSYQVNQVAYLQPLFYFHMAHVTYSNSIALMISVIEFRNIEERIHFFFSGLKTCISGADHFQWK